MKSNEANEKRTPARQSFVAPDPRRESSKTFQALADVENHRIQIHKSNAKRTLKIPTATRK
jgi:hypothetical protein